ncbi:BABA1 protein, partial [Zosterops hypoxanthus]|nr:BABA1 protein [Zosterops hypoxanthus]
MDTSEPGSAAEDEEERLPELRPRPRSNPEGAEDRAPGGQGGVGNRSEGEGEAASAGHSPPAGPGPAGSPWHGPPAGAPEVTVRTPRVNCPEKVILCLDLAEEMAVPKLESFNGSRSNALTVAQKMIEMFVRTKHKIDKSHEFALVVVNNDATWLSGFTSDPREVCSCLYDLDTVVCQSFSIRCHGGHWGQQKIELPVTDNVQTIPPPYVVRTILVFGRPGCQPHFCGGDHVKGENNQNFTLFPPSGQDMFGFFGSLDTKGTNYKYEVALAGPALELHNCMAKLLAHPLQRPCQSHAAYALLDGGDSPDSEATV